MDSIPYGYCHCGCGQKAPLAKKTYARLNCKKGEPHRFIAGHHSRLKILTLKKVLERTEEVDTGFKTPCKVWQGLVGNHGYGLIGVNEKNMLVHRFVYEQTFAKIQGKLTVHHLCAVKLCCNANHFTLCSIAENTRLIRRGNKPNYEKVAEIRQLYAQGGIFQREIAEMYGVCLCTINDIIKYRRWP